MLKERTLEATGSGVPEIVYCNPRRLLRQADLRSWLDRGRDALQTAGETPALRLKESGYAFFHYYDAVFRPGSVGFLLE